MSVNADKQFGKRPQGKPERASSNNNSTVHVSVVTSRRIFSVSSRDTRPSSKNGFKISWFSKKVLFTIRSKIIKQRQRHTAVRCSVETIRKSEEYERDNKTAYGNYKRLQSSHAQVWHLQAKLNLHMEIRMPMHSKHDAAWSDLSSPPGLSAPTSNDPTYKKMKRKLQSAN